MNEICETAEKFNMNSGLFPRKPKEIFTNALNGMAYKRFLSKTATEEFKDELLVLLS